MRAPGTRFAATAGRTTRALVEAIDLYPTLVELAALGDVRTRWSLDGVSLAPILSGEADSVREVAVSRWGRARSVRDNDHRWIATLADDGSSSRQELYAEVDGEDPLENLILELPAVAARLQSLVEAPSTDE